ncbi:MAG: hypothetical protein R3B90_07240 [Planctomycetaceae bacterium]
MHQIVGFEIEIEELAGKWKLSQNHSRDRRGRVVEQLAASGRDNAVAIARLMHECLDS